MSLYQLIYISSLVLEHNRSQSHIYETLNTLCLNKEVTGYLITSKHSFFHILEGKKNQVLNMLDWIEKEQFIDSHLILAEKPIEERKFQNAILNFKHIDQTYFDELYGLSLISIDNFLKKIMLLEAHSADDAPIKTKPIQDKECKAQFFYYSAEVSSDEVFLMNQDSKIIYVNNSACEKLGYTKEELIGLHVWEWDPLFPKEFWPGFWSDFLEKKQVHFETQHKKKTGEVFPVEVRGHLYVKKNEKYVLAFVNDISHKKKIESELLPHKIQLERILESKNEELKRSFEMLQLHKELLDIHSSMCITDGNGTIKYVNNQYCSLCGYTKEELLGQNHRLLKSGKHDKAHYQNLYKTITSGTVWRGEFCNKRKDGSLYWIDATIIPRLDKQGKPLEFYSIRTEITKRKQAEMALMEKEEQVRTILELAGDGIHILDEEGNVIECSKSFADSLGYTKEEALSLNVRDWDALIPKHKIGPILKELLHSAATFETKHKRKDNRVIDVEINAKGINLKGKQCLYASSRDISDRIKEQRKIEIMATTDQLTGLANRHKFVEFFEYNLDLAKKEDKKLVLILADLNQFKKINDKHGHLVGDDVLKHVAELLLKNCRKYDLVARIGGDEFAVLLIHTELPNAVHYIKNILLKLKQPLTSNSNKLNIGLSFGVSIFPDHAETINDLFKKADSSLYHAKKTGVSGELFFGQND